MAIRSFSGLTAALMPLVMLGCQEAHSNDAPPTSPWIATAVGRIDSEDEARQLVAAVDGVIARVYVNRGDRVAAGQPLIAIDCDARRATTLARMADARQADSAEQVVRAGTTADLAVAAAEVQSAEAVLANERQQFARAAEIQARGFLSKSAYDQRLQSKASAEAALAAARARLRDLQSGARPAETLAAAATAQAAYGEAGVANAMAEQCTLKSPVAGEVLQIFRREGEFSGASQGTPLIVVGDLSQLVVRAEINERDAALVRTGQKADIWIEGSPGRWQGRIAHMASFMGRRSARSLDPTDRFDRDVREVFVSFTGEAPPPLVGLRVTVGVRK